MNKIRLCNLACCLTACLTLALSSWAVARENPKDFLLSDEFFSDFYGAESVELMKFDGKNKTLNLPFASSTTVSRASLDEKLIVDCSMFSAFELICDVDDPSAIGYVSLYFHSKGGWYHSASPSKRKVGNKLVYVFSTKSFGKEDKPLGFDKIDAVRISFWRGADVDAKVIFHSFKASRCAYALIDVDDNGKENEGFANIFDNLLERAGMKAERVDGANVTADDLKRYAAVFLPIAGNIKPETTDAICDYIDQGGFVFAFYNAPDKLLKKLGVAVKGFVNCANKGIELSGMTFEGNEIENAAIRGFYLPKKIEQNSWNFYVVEPDPDFKAAKSLPLCGSNDVRTLAVWTLADGNNTDYPAIIASPNGVYCSHIFTQSDIAAKKQCLNAFAVAANPKIARAFARTEWLDIFNVGLEPDQDVVKKNNATINYLRTKLMEKGWFLEDAARLMDFENSSLDYSEIAKFTAAVADIKRERVDEYCRTRTSRTVEGRFWWEHSGCGIYPGDWDRTMKELADAGFNAVIPNMLWGGNAYYKSDVLPVDPKVEKYGDQIEMAVAAGKKYGVEVHVWMVCFNASNSPKWFVDKMREEGRLQRTLDGEEKPWLCPSNPENRALQLAALEEVATKYDVDGIHYDYIRFPDDRTCYCDGCKERFINAYREATGETLTDFPNCVVKDGEAKQAFKQWRCDQISALVKDVHDSLKEKRPDIKISAALFPGYPGTKASIGQDWGLWIDNGWLDFACPMDYSADPGVFENWVKRQLPYTEGKVPLYPGIGMTATGISMKAEEVVLQAEIAKKLGAQGFTIFNLAKNTAKEALPALKKGVTAKPARIPHSK